MSVLLLLSPVALLPPRVPTERRIALTPFRPGQLERGRFEQQFHVAELWSKQHSALLMRRRNDVSMYGKTYASYSADTPEYMAMSVTGTEQMPRCVVSSDCTTTVQWEALVVQEPLDRPVMEPGTPCFLAMNRFVVKPDEESRRRFEERWATRKSKLAGQPGFVSFSLLRRARPPDADAGASEQFTYATATLWASQAAWSAWREGGGRNAHAASKESSRTPVSEWMAGSASPIFWDVPVYVGAGLRHVCAPQGGDAEQEAWESSLAQLAEYRRAWGNADAPLKTALGDWCAEQRRRHASGGLPAARSDALDRLGFSWRAPSDVDDPVEAWPAMCARLRAYQAEHQSTDVPKKYKPDPHLGGWVAAVRRCRAALGAEQVAELEAIGFAWTSSRKCGSAFQDSLRRLRAFWVEHGHTDVRRVLGPDDELSLWCEAQRAAWRDGRLSPKRLAPLEELGLLQGSGVCEGTNRE